MKKILIWGSLLVVGYFALRFWSGYSLAKQVQTCAIQLNTGERLSKASPSERQEIKMKLYDCVEKNLAFPGSLGYNSKKFRAEAE